MGIDCKLNELFGFIYKKKLEDEFTEYEYDDVVSGISDMEPVTNISEVDNWKIKSFDELYRDILLNSDNYMHWFKEIYQRVNSNLLNIKNNIV